MKRTANLNTWAFRLLCAAVFSVAFSLPLGRTMIGLSVAVLTIDCVRQRRYPVFPFVAWCWVAFVAAAFVASAFGVSPARCFSKMEKLLWFIAIPLAATLTVDRRRVGTVLRAFVAGTGVLALQVLVWRPIAAGFAVRGAIAAGMASDYLWEITDLGSMTDGQTLMLGIVALAGLIAGRGLERGGSRKRRVVDGVLLLALVLALIVNLKRGSWICTFGVMSLFVFARLRVRYLLLLAAVAIGVFLLPPVWSRFSDLRQEFDVSRGGRIVMWTRIVPNLVKAHPFGIGYRALTSEMMQEVARVEGVHVEPGRNHVHSNPLQVLVSTGWLGLVVYLVWMGAGLMNGVRRIRQAPPGSSERALAWSLLLMLSGLILNGLVEYNLGDGELVVLYAVVLGMMGGQSPTASEVRID